MEKKLLLLVIVLAAVVLSASSAFALDPMGPPTAGLKQGEWRMGGEYMFSNMDIEADGFDAFGLVFESDTIKDVEVNKGFANIGTGATDNVELFLRLGGAGAKPDEADNADNVAGLFGSASGFAIGAGVKLTLFSSEDETVKWGALAQMSWVDLDFDTEGTIQGEAASGSADVSLIEAQFAFGPTVKISESMSIYGGPFLHIIDGDADLRGTIGGVTDKASVDLEEDSMFGGYIGTQIDIIPQEGEVSNGAYLFGEVLFTGDAWGAGVGLGWRF